MVSSGLRSGQVGQVRSVSLVRLDLVRSVRSDQVRQSGRSVQFRSSQFGSGQVDQVRSGQVSHFRHVRLGQSDRSN